MSLTTRDRTILLAIVPIALVLAYWFLLMTPKREEAARLGEQVTQQRQRRDIAVAAANDLGASRERFAADYTEIVRLGKAIPSTVDVPSLLVQVDAAARGTGLLFGDIKVGDRVTAPTALGAAPGQAPAAPPAGGARTTAGASGVPGLDTVPVELAFSGSFSELSRMLHRLKRFVYVGDERVLVRGRLMTIDGFKFDPSGGGRIKAEMKATVYLSPLTQGVTAGASAQGPGTATPAAAAAPAPAAASAPTPPAAVAPR